MPLEGLPQLRARNLLREDVQLPTSFAGASRNLVFVMFSREQQGDVDSWMPALDRMKGEVRQLDRWQAILMGDVGSSMQPIVEGAMRGIVKDDAIRRRYLLLYGDKPPMLAHFGHPREDQSLVLLLDGSGDVLWRGSGAWSKTTETSLRTAIAA